MLEHYEAKSVTISSFDSMGKQTLHTLLSTSTFPEFQHSWCSLGIWLIIPSAWKILPVFSSVFLGHH